MKNFRLGMLVMVLVIVLLITACGANPLKGTWVGPENTEMKLTNNSFEVTEKDSPMIKGTYATSENNITMTTTHFHGNVFSGILESKWYSKADLKASDIGAFVSDSAFETKGTYSVEGDTLIMTMDGKRDVYTRK